MDINSISQSLSLSEHYSESESVSGTEAITPVQQVPSQSLSESVLQALPSTGQESQTSLSLLGGMLLFGLFKKKKQKEEQE
ncbi:LPXTG cell wall anchor domain-containing protein [Streptococcus sp. 29896]|uniref:LPXTG cell wall anchor domain-containing protein n=1 Tax=Streptococcus suivaginalis TaxID=3028082 RepID=A0AA97A029_9STRE|nr:LPXTG cell wall anchor domain-containing protein [Streptococcus sp. 29896]WNY48107.1 LPXTG cell wall anchor domain-containing protein [Streptococcus sp. 29896]